jgi:hypothetical protein
MEASPAFGLSIGQVFTVLRQKVAVETCLLLVGGVRYGGFTSAHLTSATHLQPYYNNFKAGLCRDLPFKPLEKLAGKLLDPATLKALEVHMIALRPDPCCSCN